MIRTGNKRIGRSIVKDLNVSGIYLGPKLVWGREVELLQMFKASVLADGGIYDEELFTSEFFRVDPLIRNEAIVLIVCGAYKAGVIYGVNCITGQAVPFTFGRASVGTYFDRNGILQSVGNNIPRIDYNPVGLDLKGYLFENGVSNLVPSNLFVGNITGWTPSANTSYEFTDISTNYGRKFLRLIKNNSSGSASFVHSAINSAANTRYAARITLRAYSSSRISVGIGANNDPGTSAGAWGGLDYTGSRIVSGPGTVNSIAGLFQFQELSSSVDTVVEIWRNYVSAGVPLRMYLYPDLSTSTNAGVSVLVSSPQLEINPVGVCTSQIDTNGSQQTRAEDTLASQSDLISDVATTMYFEGSKLSSGRNSILSRRNSSPYGYFGHSFSDYNSLGLYDGTGSVTRVHHNSNGNKIKVVGSFGTEGLKLNSSDGNAISKNPNYSGIYGGIGNEFLMGTVYGDGRVQNHLRAFAILHRQLSDAEHLALTQP